MAASRKSTLKPPFLRSVRQEPELTEKAIGEGNPRSYPFNLPLFDHDDFELLFEAPVTIIVGENGTGKSTLLEAIAVAANYNVSGGGVGYLTGDEGPAAPTDGGIMAQALRVGWLPKVNQGWFFRAETFHSISRYLDLSSFEAGQRGPHYLEHSHAEGFMRFFEERYAYQVEHGNRAVYIMDEPESALSPARQFDFVRLLRTMMADGLTQVILATHSPILMAIPGADLRIIDRHHLLPVRLEDTPHFRLYREFMLYPHETIEMMTE